MTDLVQIRPPTNVSAETTVDLPGSQVVAGSLSIAIAAKSIDFVQVDVSVPFRYVWAATADLAVTAFATAALHAQSPAVIGKQITAVGRDGKTLYLEARDTSSTTTAAVTWSTYK